ncbi:DUF6907 domain-containing protein [Nocardia sp. NPDC004711]
MSQTKCPIWCSEHITLDETKPDAEPVHRSAPEELAISGTNLAEVSAMVRLQLEGTYTPEGFFDEWADLNIDGNGIELTAVEMRALAHLLNRTADQLQGAR